MKAIPPQIKRSAQVLGHIANIWLSWLDLYLKPLIGVGTENKHLSNSIYQDLSAFPVLRLIGSFNFLSLFKLYLREFVPSRFPLAITAHWYLFYIHHPVSLKPTSTNFCSSTFIYNFLPKQLHEDLLAINKSGIFLVRSIISLFQFDFFVCVCV